VEQDNFCRMVESFWYLMMITERGEFCFRIDGYQLVKVRWMDWLLEVNSFREKQWIIK
jgi:hypothetical protein